MTICSNQYLLSDRLVLAIQNFAIFLEKTKPVQAQISEHDLRN